MFRSIRSFECLASEIFFNIAIKQKKKKFYTIKSYSKLIKEIKKAYLHYYLEMLPNLLVNLWCLLHIQW